MLAFILEQLEVAFLRNRQSRDASGGKSDHRNAVRIDERLARQPGESTVSVGGARRGLARTGIADAARREAVDDQHRVAPGREAIGPEVIGAALHVIRQAAAAVQMYDCGKRPGSAGPGQKAIDDAWRGRDDGFAALEREAALQWADLIARAFELHALCGLRRVNLMRSE